MIPHPILKQDSKEQTVWGIVTPELAEEYLKLNSKNPRPISPVTVERYSKELKSGSWTVHHQGIAFDKDNNMIDGQHRCVAIVETGIPIYMPVTFNLDNSAKNNVDQPKVRTGNVVLNLNGIAKCGTSLSGIIKCAVLGLRGNRKALTNDELIKNGTRMFNGLTFVETCFTKNVKHVSTAPVKAAVLRALLAGTCEKKLSRFCDILMLKEMADRNSPSECLVFRFREWLMNSPTVRAGSAVTETYAKTERVLLAFLNDEDLKLIKGTEKELFPLPWESSEELQAVA